ncbi:MAG: endonuclease MutS2 [Terriglobia bacterium]|jgi:DNA mismatch repair protein MutS2
MNSKIEGHESQDRFSREVLEFPAVLELLRGYLSGPISEPFLDSVEPHTRIDLIRHELEQAREAREYLRESPRPTLGSLRDPRPLLEKLRIEGATLEALEIFALTGLARAALEIHRLFAKCPLPRLEELARSLADFRDLVTELDGKIHPDGSVDSSASPALSGIRRAIERLRVEVQALLERLLRRFSQEGVLQDAVVTLRNDRFVIPVRVEEKRRVQGVIHGASSSGATVYLEPMDTLPLNNELVELQDREFAEIQRILGEFSRKLRERREDLVRATQILSELDLAFAKAEFSRQYDGCIPEFSSDRTLLLKDARHPLLEKALRAQGRSPVPLSIELKPPKIMMIVSGPNTGGKTVALKTLGSAVLMAQAGIPVPASEFKLPLFRRVLADIGDQQSIAANLSTFSAHVTHIQRMAKVAGGEDMVLLDELGTSTEPNEGAALAVAILEHFRQRGALTLVTTHHSRLKAYAAETPEALNAAMEFDELTLEPTFRLLIGLPGKSSGLDIAQRLGLEPSIVEKARTILHPADAEAAALIAGLHQQKAELERQVGLLAQQGKEQEARQIELENRFEQERRAKLKDLDSRLEQTLHENEKRWESMIEQLRAQLEAAKAPKPSKGLDRKMASIKREVREEWNTQVLEAIGAPTTTPAQPLAPRPLAVGDQVQVANLSSLGTVMALPDDDQADIAVGHLHMRLPRSEVRRIVQGGTSAPRAAVAVRGSDETPAELNVIGDTAELARERVDKFLDEAYMAGRFRLRVIHGHGKGILRKSLHEMFASHPHVEKFYLAPPHEGGAGATIVELKV